MIERRHHPDLPDLALAIRQPWAHAIVHGFKDIENRDWPTRWRGPVCIHASKLSGILSNDLADYRNVVLQDKRFDHLPGDHLDRIENLLQFGGIVGVVEIVDCVTDSDSPWFFGRYGFVLANARPVDLIPVRGQLGFFKWRESPIVDKPKPVDPQGKLI